MTRPASTPRAALFRVAVLCTASLFACGDDDSSSYDDSGRRGDVSGDDAAEDTGGPDVIVVGEGEALVTWDAPTTRSDGTPLEASAIGGYRVHYGDAPRTYQQTIDVGAVGRAHITGLSPGTTYYFAVTSYDLADRESVYSDEGSKEL